MHWRRKWQPTPVFLPGESQGRGSLVGRRLWGHTESDTTEATVQQQQQTHLKHSASFHIRRRCTGTTYIKPVIPVGFLILPLGHYLHPMLCVSRLVVSKSL